VAGCLSCPEIVKSLTRLHPDSSSEAKAAACFIQLLNEISLAKICPSAVYVCAYVNIYLFDNFRALAFVSLEKEIFSISLRRYAFQLHIQYVQYVFGVWNVE